MSGKNHLKKLFYFKLRNMMHNILHNTEKCDNDGLFSLSTVFISGQKISKNMMNMVLFSRLELDTSKIFV